MSNINKQDLRLTAEKAKDNFMPNFMVPTRDLLALLDELEAKDKQIDDLKATAAHSNAGWKEAHEQEARAEAAEKRIVELESREINMPPYSFFDFKQGSPLKSGAYCHIDSVNKELAKHGIKMTAAAGKGE